MSAALLNRCRSIHACNKYAIRLDRRASEFRWWCAWVLVAAYYWTNVSRVLLFWAAFILTRPLGATVGDFLDKPLNQGGLALSRPMATAVIGAFLIFCLLVLPQRAGQHPTETEPAT